MLEQAAAALGVSTADLLGSEPAQKKRGKGPVGKMQRLFEQASQLPRAQREKIAAVIEAFVTAHGER